MKRIVILASGSGSNAENIIEYFRENPGIGVIAVLSNKPAAGVFERCDRLEVPAYYFSAAAFKSPDGLLRLLKGLEPDLIVLAGFLWKMPPHILEAFPNGIVNIHPALLPKYGGKGMYGERVHRAVVENGEGETGISIHYVNRDYDQGAIIFQAKVPVEPGDSPQTVAQKVHALEYEHFPKIIEKLLS